MDFHLKLINYIMSLTINGLTTKKTGLSQCFEKRWDSPKKRRDMVKIPIPTFFFPSASDRRFLNVGIGSCEPVPALFKSAGIGPGAFKPYSGVFKSAGTAFMKM